MANAALENPLLDTIISLALIYAFLSLLVSALLEVWNKKAKQRGIFLQKVVMRLLNDPLNKNYGYLIYQHPIINTMRRDENSYPHYIPAEGFANALIDTLAEEGRVLRTAPFLDGLEVSDRLHTLVPEQRARILYRSIPGADPGLAQRLVDGVAAMKDSELKRLFQNFLDRNPSVVASGAAAAPGPLDLKALKEELGRWFDDYMERATGEYKNDQSNKLLILSAVVALCLNVDSIHLTRVLLIDTELRERMVSEAEQVVDTLAKERNALSLDTLPPAPISDSTLAQTTSTTADTVRAQVPFRADPRTVEQVVAQDSLLDGQVEQVLGLVRGWQLPIGWSEYEAPLSWFHGDRQERLPATLKPSQRTLMEHFNRRNALSGWNVLLWIAGILITIVSLSLGAPFWFDLLVKLVNLRRSGLKPKTMAERRNP
jgi:hypothetical protein